VVKIDELLFEVAPGRIFLVGFFHCVSLLAFGDAKGQIIGQLCEIVQTTMPTHFVVLRKTFHP
jgi:hypothetical protein